MAQQYDEAAPPNYALLVGGAVALAAVVLMAVKTFGGSSAKPATKASGTSSTVKPTVIAPVTARKASEAPEDTSMTPLSVWFGSQTGTAEGYAKGLAKAAAKHGFRAKALDLESWTPEKFSQSSGGLAVFVMATYGEGDPTDNAVDFTKWLKDPSTPPAAAAGVRFTVFGLGNRQYEHYNAMGKLVNERLAALGGARVYAHGEGDDEGNMEEDWETWVEGGLWDALRAAAGMGAEAAGASGSSSSSGAGALPTPGTAVAALPWRVVTVPAPASAGARALGHAMAPAACARAALTAELSSRHLFAAVPAKVTANRELRQAPGVGSSTRHVEVDLTGTGISYATADNAFVVPDNETKTVEALATWLGYDLGEWFTVEPADSGTGPAASPTSAGKLPFPTPCSVRALLTRFTDLHGAPKRDLFEALAPFATKASERARLALLGSRDGRDEFHSWVTESQRSVWEVFQAFPSVKLPLAAFVALMPRQGYRAYTIASSSAVSPASLHICASVIDAPKPGGESSRRLQGVASNHMLRLATSASPQLHVYVRPSTFHLPSDASTPVILVGPGTGLAPMRAFLQERRHQCAVQSQRVGETVLFFGCRGRDEDFIYRDELEGYAADGTLTALHLAFSREGASKVYVQHLIAAQGEAMWSLLRDRGAHVYVCGATKMGTDVQRAFEEVALKHGKLSASAAGAFLVDLKAKKRYIQELWTS